ncbi:hypothetical protein LOK49_LG03G00642 [Camellia lanceoleosa]|uniref:Uncharacterized protein n=1 Tax=Camellia lanceoleosa TaxID=1840588 RepID=A0ACC0ID77_9ERIC|nr:hypothetical protein LOK49_LG03G00642 [Camellia lanceoleosa]
MADEAPNSKTPPQNVEQASVESTIESNAEGGTESSCDNINLQTSTLTTSDGDREKSLEYADELMERGSKASKDRDYSEATDCYSRALEIRLRFIFKCSKIDGRFMKNLESSRELLAFRSSS